MTNNNLFQCLKNFHRRKLLIWSLRIKPYSENNVICDGRKIFTTTYFKSYKVQIKALSKEPLNTTKLLKSFFKHQV